MIDLKHFSMEDFTIHIEAPKRDLSKNIAKVGIYRRVNKPAYVHHQSSLLEDVL